MYASIEKLQFMNDMILDGLFFWILGIQLIDP